MFAKLFKEKTSDSLQDLDVTRAAIASTKAALTRIASLPIAFEEADARIDAFFAETAAQYRPEVGAFLTPGRPRHVDVVGYKQEQAVLAALWGPQLAADWKARLRAQLGDSDTVTAADRARLLEEHTDALRVLEEREERIILAAEAAGIEVDRRGDADPDVVLAVTLA